MDKQCKGKLIEMNLRVTRGKRPARRNTKLRPGMPIPSPKRRNLEDSKDAPEVIVGYGDNGGYWLLPDFGHQSGDILNMMRGIAVFGALRWQVWRVGSRGGGDLRALPSVRASGSRRRRSRVPKSWHKRSGSAFAIEEIRSPPEKQCSWIVCFRSKHGRITSRAVIRPVLMPPSSSQVKNDRLGKILMLA